MTEMSQAPQIDLQTLNSELAQLRADLAKVSDAIKDVARQSSASAVYKGKQLAAEVQEHVRQHAQTVTETIEEKPVVASLVAFGIGFIIGAMFRSRST
jgi:ElaB/YqjD/DUF883 family membrane-anchored ribosome-binding protein